VVFANGPQLVQRGGIDEDAALQEAAEVFGELLGRQRDVLSGNAGVHGAFDLVAAGGVDVEAHAVEEFEDGRVGGGFHRVADGEPERVREGEAGVGTGAQGGFVVNIDRRAKLLSDLAALGGGKETKGFNVAVTGK